MPKNQVVDLKGEELTHFIVNKEGSVRAELLHELDTQLIKRCIVLYNGNQTRIAEVLGLNRGTLRTRMKQLGLLEGAA